MIRRSGTKSKISQILTRPSAYDLFSLPIPGIQQEKWEEMLEKQERDMIILEIREEIMDRVIEKCNKIYFNRVGTLQDNV